MPDLVACHGVSWVVARPDSVTEVDTVHEEVQLVKVRLHRPLSHLLLVAVAACLAIEPRCTALADLLLANRADLALVLWPLPNTFPDLGPLWKLGQFVGS